ncbi:MAG TPA: hypothetical protein VGI95_18680 [Caulobacteraceae bacterium]
MAMRSLTLTACLAALAVVGIGGTAFSADRNTGSNCFLSRDWEGWKSPSPNVIYLRVGVRQIFEIDLSSGSNQLQEGDMHLIDKVRGSDWICSPLDLDLQIADDHGVYAEPLIVKSITRLTADQVAAIPRKFLP